ncbi:FAD-binding oxidoreductase, partial [Candidatus Sumerlaeota bacterium]|nr:FAD-binding oxidoreductase [Candidatus Sumerlaeota bacterium]
MLGISKTVPDQAALERDLKAGIKGEVLLDPAARGLYSTDASIYQIEPIAVVIPRDKQDVLHALKVARERKLTVLPRGGGTSLAGQTVGQSVVLDFSKYMNQILEVNAAEQWARVQPGRVRDELNAQIAPTGLHFGPETTTSNRANIGGMIGNNSAGTRSIIYERTVNHVLELDIALASGEEVHLRKMPRKEWDQIASRDTTEGRIYKGVREIVLANREEIIKRYPKVMRRVGGYNLDEFLGDEWNMSSLIVGSEGTLATVLEAKLNLVPLPKAKAMCVIHYRRMPECLRSVAPIVKHGPSMVELLDQSILHPAMNHPEVKKICDWIAGDPFAVLIVEFFGDTIQEAEKKIDALIAEMRSTGYGYAHPKMITVEEQAKVMGVRSAGQGLMMGMKGDAKSIDFIDDSAVPLDVLPDYIAEVMKVCDDLRVPVAAYAHASVGLLHVRPILNLKLAEDIEKMKLIAERTFVLVQKYGGSWSGEHGDGLVRSFMNQRYFGDQLYNAFKEVKRLFDPENRMNPGKIVDAQGIEENLRMG